MTLLRAAARTLLASYFISSGVGAVRRPDELVPAAQPVADALVPFVKRYAPDQLAWLEAIRDYLAANIELSTADLQDQFTARGGIIGARRLFGPRLDTLLDELQDALVA